MARIFFRTMIKGVQQIHLIANSHRLMFLKNLFIGNKQGNILQFLLQLRTRRHCKIDKDWHHVSYGSEGGWNDVDAAIVCRM